jgi:hypothetical protein
MSRIRVLLVVLALGSIILNPLPAQAGSVWDANDSGHRLDIRWVGAYQQADGRMRVTVSFYDRVRTRWFNRPSDPLVGIPAWTANLRVGFAEDRAGGMYWFALFLRTRHDGLIAWLCESGSGCSGGTPSHVGRPDSRTIRARIPTFDRYGPTRGWFFRGFSRTHDLKTAIDRTHWGVFT